MYAPAVAEQLRARGHDVLSIHDPGFRWLEGEPDREVFAVAVSEGRAVVTEDVAGFGQLEAESLAQSEQSPGLIFTTNRQFPRGDPATIGRLVLALDALLREPPSLVVAIFLKVLLPS